MKRILHILGPLTETNALIEPAAVRSHLCGLVKGLARQGVVCDVAWTEARFLDEALVESLEHLGIRSYLATVAELPALAAHYALVHVHVFGDSSLIETLPGPRVVTVHGVAVEREIPAAAIFCTSHQAAMALEGERMPLCVDPLRFQTRELPIKVPEEIEENPEDSQNLVLLRPAPASRVDRALFWTTMRRLLALKPIRVLIESPDDLDWALFDTLPESQKSLIESCDTIDWASFASGKESGIVIAIERALGCSRSEQLAMAAGLPFVSLKGPDAESEGGVVCAPLSEDLAQAVIDLVNSSALRFELSARGHAALNERLHSIVTQVAKIYRRCGAICNWRPKPSSRRLPRDLLAPLGLRAQALGRWSVAGPNLQNEPTLEALSELLAFLRAARPDSVAVLGDAVLPAVYAGEALRLAGYGTLILESPSKAQIAALERLSLPYSKVISEPEAADVVVVASDTEKRRGRNLTILFANPNFPVSEGLLFGHLAFVQARGGGELRFQPIPFEPKGELHGRVLHATLDGHLATAADASVAALLSENVTGSVALVGERAWKSAVPGPEPRVCVTVHGLAELASDFDLVHFYGDFVPDQVPPPVVQTPSDDPLIWIDTKMPVSFGTASDNTLGENELVTYVCVADVDDKALFWRVARCVLEVVPGLHLAISGDDMVDAALRAELPDALQAQVHLLGDDFELSARVAAQALLILCFAKDECLFQQAASRGIPCLLVGGKNEDQTLGYQVCANDSASFIEAWRHWVEDPDAAAFAGNSAHLDWLSRREVFLSTTRRKYLEVLGPKFSCPPSGDVGPRDLSALLQQRLIQSEGRTFPLVKHGKVSPPSFEVCDAIYRLLRAENARRVLVLGPQTEWIAPYAAEALRLRDGLVMVEPSENVDAWKDLYLPVRSIVQGSVPDALEAIIFAGSTANPSELERWQYILSALTPNGMVCATEGAPLRPILRKAQLRAIYIPTESGLFLARTR